MAMRHACASLRAFVSIITSYRIPTGHSSERSSRWM
ncbi:hypothetical protein LCGC14_2710140, partial [marine sediment metagenome]